MISENNLLRKNNPLNDDMLYQLKNKFQEKGRQALKIYKSEKKVWHINGFNYPVKFDGNFECFFMSFLFKNKSPRISCLFLSNLWILAKSL